MDLALLQNRWNRNDQRELGKIALKIIAHADYSAITVADEDDLGRFVEELRVRLADIESAKCARGCRREGGWQQCKGGEKPSGTGGRVGHG